MTPQEQTASDGRPVNDRTSFHPCLLGEQRPNDMVLVNTDDYPGGVGMWGAVPASYDTTRRPIDRGIHVHGRSDPLQKAKALDQTFRSVTIQNGRLPQDGIVVSEAEAIYFMISTVFGLTPQAISCPACGHAHLDEDWFSVHPHHEHSCNWCFEKFSTPDPVVGNPVARVRESCGLSAQAVVRSTKELVIRQADYPAGMLIWGSNPAFLWTGGRPEQEGMHVHVFGDLQDGPVLDETYGRVVVDGIEIDAVMVRTLMAQNSLPMLTGKLSALRCSYCNNEPFDSGLTAISPRVQRSCAACGCALETDRRGETCVSNPVLRSFTTLAAFAPRCPQVLALNLRSMRA